jgi:hypothetical protein
MVLVFALSIAAAIALTVAAVVMQPAERRIRF